MYVFIECWKARQEWLDLDKETRAAYMSELGKGIDSLIQAGVEIVSWSINQPDTSHKAPYDYFAVWKFPNQEMVKGFEQIVQQSGWYNYFDQVNLSGEVAPPGPSILKMIDL
jgi:hypothetical protein